ncbi:response regulator [Piscirickettsia litoralis]|uniref:Response regulatory domain-containing protein n=1 Tax=Piscirickettsia litoralis TaxID=1891921 RepID=A0ABX2ZZY0_9GAMM|nr:response regulator [Piscirickettsia litoralis]ODN42122.1 hypothetical protein BGC07_03125 [Piscirickettsia litoralis]
MDKLCLNLLLVEDDVADQNLILLALKKVSFSYNLQIKTNGLDALSYIQQSVKNERYPQVMLLDINLPKLTGLQLLEKLSAHSDYGTKKFPHVYTVMFTTSKFEADKKQAFDLGADDYFEKPSSLQPYIDLLERSYYSYLAKHQVEQNS